MPEMDAMELDRYVTGMIDNEYRDMKRDVKAKRKSENASESLKNGPVTRFTCENDNPTSATTERARRANKCVK